jgi:hypothetical protein
MRVSEALGLRWDDVDFDNQEIRVRFQLDAAASAMLRNLRRRGRSVRQAREHLELGGALSPNARAKVEGMRVLLVAVAFATAAPATYVAGLDSGAAPVLAGARIATLRQAVRSFGKPDRVVPPAGTRAVCRAVWQQIGLEIQFSAASGCTAPGSWWQVTMRRLRWHTRLGLRVGDGETKLHALYPDARRLDFLGLGALWELEAGGPFCDGGPPLALAGRIGAGKVDSLLVVHVPACG